MNRVYTDSLRKPTFEKNRYKRSIFQTCLLYLYKDPLFVQDPHNQIIESDKQKSVNQRGQISVGKNEQDGGINLPLQTNSTNCDNLEQSSQHTGYHIDEQRIRAKNMERIRPFLFFTNINKPGEKHKK